jgi:DNA topoisomerase-1
MAEGDPMVTEALEAAGHETQPPARFTEASLVKRLEELGVGRPSTYASIISTVQDRGYVWKKGSALVPSFTAFAVITLLEQHFPDLVDYAFTARMEEELDDIASGSADMEPWLAKFYFGVADGNGEVDGLGLKRLVEGNLGEIDAREVNSIPLGRQDGDDREIVARVGRYGPYLERGEGDDSSARASPMTSRPTSSPSSGRSSCSRRRRAIARSAPTPRPAWTCSSRRAGSGPTSRRACTTTRPGSSRAPRACSRTWTPPR